MKEYEVDLDWGLGELASFMASSELNLPKEHYQAAKEAKAMSFFNTGGILSNRDAANIAVITMSGVMMVEGGMCSYGMRDVVREFEKAYSMSNVEGIIFNVHSGGGESTAGDMIYNVLMDRNKPVVTHTSYLCSAAIKATLPSDEIITYTDATLVGSIGTMYSIDRKALKYLMKNNFDIYSKKSPRKNEEFRSLLQGDASLFENRATELDERFMDRVKKNRKLQGGKSMVNDTLSGAVFVAGGNEGAKARGLVDGHGSFQYAVKRLNSHIKSFNR